MSPGSRFSVSHTRLLLAPPSAGGRPSDPRPLFPGREEPVRPPAEPVLVLGGHAEQVTDDPDGQREHHGLRHVRVPRHQHRAVPARQQNGTTGRSRNVDSSAGTSSAFGRGNGYGTGWGFGAHHVAFLRCCSAG